MPLDFMEFPYPVKKNLIDQMSKIDLVRVSLQSQRADMALKECGKTGVSFFDLDFEDIYRLSCIDRAELFFLEVARQGTLPEWELDVSVDVGPRFEVYFSSHGVDTLFMMRIDSLNNIGKYNGVKQNLMIENNLVPAVVIDMDSFVTFWDDKSAGLIFILQNFLEKLGKPIQKLSILDNGTPKYSDDLRRIIRSCSQMTVVNISVEYFNSYRRNKKKLALSEENYKFIMENLSVTETFEARLETSGSFKFDGTIRAKFISIKYGHWFNHQHLLEWVDYEKLDVKGKKFTVMEVRTFMRKWVAGGFPKLKSLTLESEQMFNEAIEGFEQRKDIPDQGTSRNKPRYIKGCDGNYATISSRGGRWPGFKMEVEYQALN